ncbi:MAG: phospholipid carrier-dependent glycosyltransferase, partial [Solirubrobacteraceae bacterium]
MRAVIRANWLFALLLGIGALVRLLAMIAYPPGLFFGDSWGYISTAYAGGSITLPSLRPVGYSVLIRVLAVPGRSILTLATIQHLAGLAIGTLVYLALVRARVPRPVAAAASALVVLDGYAITLEQYVMSDTFFTATLLACVLVLAWPRLASRAPGRLTSPVLDQRTPIKRCALAGLLVALASLLREAGPFVVPVLLVYLLWSRAGWRALVAFILAAALPLLAYSAV